MDEAATWPESWEVILVSNSLAGGGSARALSLLANALAASGTKVRVLVFRRGSGEYGLHPAIDRVYASDGNGMVDRIRRIHWLRAMLTQAPRANVVAFEYFVNIDVLLAAVGLPNRVIVSERNDPARVGNKFPSDMMRKILYQRAAALVCQTDEAAAYFSDRIRKAVILNPIKPDLPPPFVGDRRKTVVTFARLEPQKNLAMLVRAFAQFHQSHSDYTLEIYGDGSERGALVALARDLGVSAVVAVLPSRSDIFALVRDCAVFVLPSNYEGLSNSMLEAMALGIPTICTDCPCGGARMVIEDGVNGILIPVGDEAALASALNLLADNVPLASAIGTAGVALRERLSLDSIVSKWKQLIQPGEPVRS